MVAILTCWLGFSFIFPIHASIWLRRAYLGAEIALAVLAKTLDWGVDLLLYLFIAKACFLLNRRDLGRTHTFLHDRDELVG
jgi:hypothetical protein